MAASGNDAADVKCAGTGRLSQLVGVTGLTPPAWAPNVGESNVAYHELVRSDTGIVWASRGVYGDTANRWKRVNAVRVDDPYGSGGVFAPYRALDTRDGQPLQAGEGHLRGLLGYGNVPQDTIAVFGNLTAVAPIGTGGYASGGYLTVYPNGNTVPTVSNVNPAPTGQHAFPNFFFCAVGNLGGLAVYTSVETHVVVDIFAYVQ